LMFWKIIARYALPQAPPTTWTMQISSSTMIPLLEPF
jgi:hypothetical protein